MHTWSRSGPEWQYESWSDPDCARFPWPSADGGGCVVIYLLRDTVCVCCG